jgi:hypothetical protein
VAESSLKGSTMELHHITTSKQQGPIAYIDSAGDLIIKRKRLEDDFINHDDEKSQAVFLSPSGGGSVSRGGLWRWDPDNPNNQAVFYEGDSVTITF